MSTPTTTTTTTPPPPPPPLPPPPPPPTLLIPSLPNDISLNILARIPRCHHPTLSLVSKPFGSLISSPLFFTTRSLLHSTQPILYLSLRHRNTSPPLFHFYTLHQNPTTQKNLLSLTPIPPIPSPPLIGSVFVSVGPKIYIIGGSINDIPSPQMWTLDCRFHTYEPAPNMLVGHKFAIAGAINNYIYVIGGCVVDTWQAPRTGLKF